MDAGVRSVTLLPAGARSRTPAREFVKIGVEFVPSLLGCKCGWEQMAAEKIRNDVSVTRASRDRLRMVRGMLPSTTSTGTVCVWDRDQPIGQRVHPRAE